MYLERDRWMSCASGCGTLREHNITYVEFQSGMENLKLNLRRLRQPQIVELASIVQKYQCYERQRKAEKLVRAKET